MKLQNQIWAFGLGAFFTVAGSLYLASCSAAGTGEDSSASGLAAGSVGGALGSTSSTGTVSLSLPVKNQSVLDFLMPLVPDAYASTTCPTIKSGSGCTQVNSGTADLAYTDCGFGTGATWSGVLQLTAGTVTCGTFPVITSGTLTRQFVTSTSSATPASGARTSLFGTIVNIDHSATNLSNFNDTVDTLSGSNPYVSGGTWAQTSATDYTGEMVTFTSGKRTGVTVSQHLYTITYDHSLNGTVAVSESAVIGTATKTVTGNMTLFHNKLKIVGVATFNDVTYTNSCCQPTGGSISTAYQAALGTGAVAPTTVGETYVGKTETLTFTGCGTATYASPLGTTSSVTVSHCF